MTAIKYQENSNQSLVNKFRKKAFCFLMLATKSDQVLSALEFFDKSFDLSDIDTQYHDNYRDFFASILIDNLNTIPQEKRKLISISFVEPQSSGSGFRLLGDIFKYDIIALKGSC